MPDEAEFPALSSAALRVLREDKPSACELEAAYARFARGPQRRAPGMLVARWLVAGLVMGLGVAFGAEAAVQQLRPEQPASPVAPAVVTRAATLRVPLPSPPRTPELVAPLPSASAPAPARAPSAASPKASLVSADEAPADSAVWTKAAEGLRNNDFAETQAALAMLEHAGSSSDREAARLIRAQLMLHQGDKSGARALLLDLASNAQAAQVRAKARSLLAETAPANSPLIVAPSGT